MDEPVKLLIAYDGSSCADAALDDLSRAGLPHAAEVLVLSVADVLLPPAAGGPEEPDPEWLVAAINKARARSLKAVEEARATALRASERIQTEHPAWQVRAEACGDSPAWAVIDKAREWKADLILVGAHGHSSTGRIGARERVTKSRGRRVLLSTCCTWSNWQKGFSGAAHRWNRWFARL